MDLPSKQDTIIKCEWYMDRLKPGWMDMGTGNTFSSSIFDEIFSGVRRQPHGNEPYAKDFFKNL